MEDLQIYWDTMRISEDPSIHPWLSLLNVFIRLDGHHSCWLGVFSKGLIKWTPNPGHLEKSQSGTQSRTFWTIWISSTFMRTSWPRLKEDPVLVLWVFQQNLECHKRPQGSDHPAIGIFFFPYGSGQETNTESGQTWSESKQGHSTVEPK